MKKSKTELKCMVGSKDKTQVLTLSKAVKLWCVKLDWRIHHIYIYIYIYIYKSKYGLKSDIMKVVQKHNQNRWIYYDVKSTLTFRFQLPSSGFDIKIIHITMDVCWYDMNQWEIYNEKIHKRRHRIHNSKVIRTCLAHVKKYL